MSAAAALSAALSGLGSRWGLWHFRTGFVILKVSAYAGLAGALAGAVLMWKGARVPGLAAVLTGLCVAGVPWLWMRAAKTVPMIHDITTDTVDPPSFVAILPIRKDAPNPASYGGPDVAQKQKAAYPYIVPKVLEMPPEEAYDKALSAARNMGWEIVDSNPKEGRIEATATTFWFKFKDDIVIRVERTIGGSKIDARSVSRVGKSDVGTNARRLRKYLELFSRYGNGGPGSRPRARW